jgi:hypothetical protein
MFVRKFFNCLLESIAPFYKLFYVKKSFNINQAGLCVFLCQYKLLVFGRESETFYVFSPSILQ